MPRWLITEGRSEKPDSSSKTVHAWRRLAFFYHGPPVSSPGGDGVLVSLDRPARGTLTAPAETCAQDRPRLGRRIAHPGHLLDHCRDSTQRPEFGGEAVACWPLREGPLGLDELLIGEPRYAPGALRAGQTLHPVLAPRRVPLRGGLSRHAQLTDHVGLRRTIIEHLAGAKSTLGQRLEVPTWSHASARRCWHRRRGTSGRCHRNSFPCLAPISGYYLKLFNLPRPNW